MNPERKPSPAGSWSLVICSTNNISSSLLSEFLLAPRAPFLGARSEPALGPSSAFLIREAARCDGLEMDRLVGEELDLSPFDDDDDDDDGLFSLANDRFLDALTRSFSRASRSRPGASLNLLPVSLPELPASLLTLSEALLSSGCGGFLLGFLKICDRRRRVAGVDSLDTAALCGSREHAHAILQYSESPSLQPSTHLTMAPRQSLLPSFLYAPSAAESGRVVAGAPSEPPFGKIEMFSPAYYGAGAVGGAAACGVTHAAVTPLDVIKCNIQIDPVKYKSTSSAFGVVMREQGVHGFFRGWAPTFLGYSAQGAFKYGLYEVFKKQYSDIAGPEYAAKYKTLIYLAGSATAEVFADVALCPMEAVKVRVQTQPGYARGLRDGFPKIVRAEGYSGLFRGLVPLWGRQIPYTMMKFATYENIVEMAYKHLIPTPKDQCSKPLQLGVSFGSGYVAGVFCAVVSHPADNLVSFLNNAKGATVGDAVKNLGLWGLFTRGLPLRILMIGTLTGTQWVIYDSFKVMVGLPTTGGAPAPAAIPVEGLAELKATA